MVTHQRRWQHIFFGMLLSVACWFVLSALLGGVFNYSPVPVADSWAAYQFFPSVQQGHWSAWWAQHNEHRILLTRVMFWIGFACLQEAMWLWIVVNYVLVAASCLIFIKMIRSRFLYTLGPYQTGYLCCAAIAALCSWTQKENFICGFQIQFFLAQLLPLLGFYCLQRSVEINQQGRDIYFAAAVIAGVAATGAMANGVLALPLMILYAVYFKLGKRSILLLLSMAIISSLLYGYHYVSPASHSSFFNSILRSPFRVFRYTGLYLSGSIFHLFGNTDRLPKNMGCLIGDLMLLGTAYYTYWHRRQLSPWGGALLCLIAYVILTALVTAGGRIKLGLMQALSSRYATPSVMAWEALFLLYIDWFVRSQSKRMPWLGALCLCSMLMMLPMQRTAWKTDSAEVFDKKIAGLAMELQVTDPERMAVTGLPVEAVLNLSKQAMLDGLSFTGEQSIHHGLAPLWSAILPAETWPVCLGGIDQISLDKYYSEKHAPFIRIQGWIYDPTTQQVPQKLQILNAQGRVIGYAITGGKVRHAVKILREQRIHQAGFEGYVLADQSIHMLVGWEPPSRLSALRSFATHHFSTTAAAGSMAALCKLPVNESMLATCKTCNTVSASFSRNTGARLAEITKK